MKKLPYGISNYEELIEDGYYYVDKTMYIEKLENLAEKRILFLRPRKFGKTLFTSTLENYYDLKKVDKFERLYGQTYIGKNPTKLKNSYHILKFNFSGIDTENEETTIKGFKKEVASSIKLFVEKYGLDFYINTDDEAENILDNLIKAFTIQKAEEKIYNSNMCLYFLNNYVRFHEVPEQIIDVNIASDYTRLGKMLDLCQGEEREKVIEKTVSGEGIVSEIRQKFNPAMEFTETDLVSMLYYLGYLTIEDEEIGYPKLNIPNKVMKEM